MFKVITNLLPVKVWLVLGAVALQGVIIGVAYNNGIDKERLRNQSVVQEALDKYTNEQLTLLQHQLQEALSFNKAKEVISSNQEKALASIRNQSKKLQEALDAAVKANTNNTCNTLDDSYVRLYEQMYNKTPTSRDN